MPFLKNQNISVPNFTVISTTASPRKSNRQTSYFRIYNISMDKENRWPSTSGAGTKTRLVSPPKTGSLQVMSRRTAFCIDPWLLFPFTFRLSITTKVSGLYPGHDILSKRVRRKKQCPNDIVYNVFIPRWNIFFVILCNFVKYNKLLSFDLYFFNWWIRICCRYLLYW